jgi:predicted PurR-regulated permease PerM
MEPVRVRSKGVSELSVLAPLITMAIVISALHFGQEVLIPFALALLLSFLLTPVVARLEKLRLGRVPSVLLVLTLAFSLLGGILWLGSTQFAEIVSKIPEYQENVHRKIEAMRNPAGSVLTKAIDSVRQASDELSRTAEASETQKNLSPSRQGKRTTRTAQGPLAVEIVKDQPHIVASLGLIGTSLAHFIGLALAILVFTAFMLTQRGDLRNRLFRLFGLGHLNVMTVALDDAAGRISRYLLTQSIINGAFGLLLGLGLYWIGVPNAPFWAVLGAILRFIPYVGTLIAGICPFVLALVVFDGWLRPMLTLGLFAVIELTMSAAIEPWLCGARTGISSLAVLVSAAFWALLWGPIGLVLSTPLTVCLLVLGKYVPPLKFLGVLLGEEEVLPPEACLYQRMLAMDEDEAQEIAQTHLKEKTFGEFCDAVLIPALSLAEQDRHRNALAEDREEFIYRSTRDLIEDLAEQAPVTPLEESVQIALVSQPSVVCMPARDEADELVGRMLAHFLRQSGYNAEAIPLGTVEDMFRAVQQRQTDILFVSALPPFAIVQARALCRKVRRTSPDLKIVVGLWGSTVELDKVRDRLGSGCSDHVITSLRQAELEVKLFAGATEFQDAEGQVPIP